MEEEPDQGLLLEKRSSLNRRMKRRIWSPRQVKIAAGVSFAALIIIGLVTAPWWFTWLVWQLVGTSWAEGVDPNLYNATNQALSQERRIPKILHQTWKNETIPLKWSKGPASCRGLHPDYEYKFWTDESSRDFIVKEHPKLLKTWDSYPYAIQRADIIRYAVLQTYGGYYLDIDIVCLHPLDFLAKYPIVLPKTWPVGFSNDFIASEPNNPFMKTLVDSIPGWSMNLIFKYPTVMFSTGPMFVTLKATMYKAKKSLWVLTDEMYNKYSNTDKALFIHLHGSSWHGDDAKSILWILRHPVGLAVLTLTVLILLGAGYWIQLRRRRRYKAKLMSSKRSDLLMTHITVIKDV